MVACGEQVPPPSSTIGFSPSSLSLTADEGGANPASQTLTIWNSGEGTLSWWLSDSATWLTLSPTSGASVGETDSITVMVDIYGMDAGNYAATITISAPGAANDPQTMAVNLAITPGSKQVLFSDDFSDEYSGWETYSDEEGSAFYQGGWLHVKDAAYGEYSAGSYAYRYFTNFVLEVETKLVGGTDYNWHLIACRSDSEGNNDYSFGISADGYYGIAKTVNGNQIFLKGPTLSSYIHKGQGITNLVRVECIGSTLSLSVNGHLLAEVIDYSHTSGDIALGVNSLTGTFTEIAFDNIVVTEPFTLLPESASYDIVKPTVGYVPQGWYCEYDDPYGTYEDIDGTKWGLIKYTDNVDYDFVQIFYGDVSSELEGKENDRDALIAKATEHAIFEPTESGTMVVAGELAGWVKAYDPEYDIYKMEIAFVKGSTCVGIFTEYDATYDDEAQAMSLIDSINLLE